MVLKKELDQVPLHVLIPRLDRREILYFIFLTIAKESPMNFSNHLRSIALPVGTSAQQIASMTQYPSQECFI